MYFSERLVYFDLEDVYELSKKIYEDFRKKIQYNYLGEYFEAGEMQEMVFEEIRERAMIEFSSSKHYTNHRMATGA
jgi:hypothetical protein